MGNRAGKRHQGNFLKEMIYLFVALYLFDMITYTGQGGHMSRDQ